MKNTIMLAAALGATVAVAQYPSGFPECGVTCINNMVAKASEFNCQPNDRKCFCTNQDFIYGVRDCSNQACQNQGSASTVQDYGAKFCAEASVSITYAPSTGGSAASPTVNPLISSFTTVITSGGSTLTSTGSTTVDGQTAATSSAASESNTNQAMTTITSDGSTYTNSLASVTQSIASSLSSVLSSISSASTSLASDASAGASSLSSVASEASSSASDALASATSSTQNLAPQMTAAPAGFLAAAGIAAFLL